jgi:hypothetical protein
VAVDDQLSFPVKGPKGKDAMRIRLKHKKRDDGTYAVTQVEIHTWGSGGDDTVKFPDPLGGEGTPPSPPPEESTDPRTTIRGHVRGRDGSTDAYVLTVFCPPDVDHPHIRRAHTIRNPDGSIGDHDSETYEIDEKTQDSLNDFLKASHWKWGNALDGASHRE